MPANRRALATFLSENTGRSILRVRAMTVLEPLCRKADAGYYDADCGRCGGGCVLRDALSAALGEKVLKIELVTVDEAARRGPSFLRELQADIGRTLANALGRVYGGKLADRLGRDAHARMERVFWEGVGEPIWHSFEGNRWDALGHSLLLVARGGLLAAAADLYGFAIAGDTVNFSRLAPLVGVLSRAIVLGERVSEPGTWVVVAD